MLKDQMEKIFLIIVVFCSITVSVSADMIQVVYTEYPPFTYTENKKAEGFAIEILQAMFQESKIDATIKSYPWKRAEKILEKHSNTLAFLTRNKKREHCYEWIGPVYPRTIALYKLRNRSEIQVNSVEDAGKYRIGVVRGYAGVNDLIKAGVSHKNLEEVHNDNLNIRKLYRKHIDLLLNNDIVLAHLLRQEGHNFNEVEKVLMIIDEGKSYYYFSLNKDTDENLVKRLRQAFIKIKNEEVYNSILQNYQK